MFELSDVYREVENSRKKLKWLISGIGIHGLKLSDNSHLTWDWITENYNIESHECKHLDVCSISTIVALHDISNDGIMEFTRCYDGYCTSCQQMVHGYVGLESKIKKRWK